MKKPVNIAATNTASAEIYDYDASAHHPAVTALLAEGASSAAIEQFLSTNAFPLTEPGAVTFAFHGPADRVELLRWIHGGADRSQFERVPETALWLLRLAAENDGRFEYKLNIVNDNHENWTLDPLNPARAGDPFGENSVCRTWGYRRPVWSEPRGAPTGTIENIEIHSPTFDETRTEQVYLPAGYAPGVDHPLVVIHDGADFMTYADLSVSLDNLIDAGDIPPALFVLIQTGDRLGEYPNGRRHARYLVNELLPRIAESYAISPEPADRILLGASLGAVASLATAFRYPGVFGGLILKSGSFILDREALGDRGHPVFHRVARLVSTFKRAPNLPDTRAFISTGELEGLADENRALANFLHTRGVDVLFRSAWDGHHWHNWRDQLRDGLMWVLRRDNK